MTRRRSLLCASLALSGLVSGCTITKMREDNAQTTMRVSDKEAELRRENEAQAQLRGEHERLMADLQTRELSVEEMNRRLRELQRLNANSLAGTPAQQQQKLTRQRQLDEAARAVKTLEQDSSAATAEAKARRLEEGRRKLRQMLELIAVT